MKKKMFFSVAAAAAMLMANPVTDRADAASNCPTPAQVKMYTYQSGNLTNEQIDSILKKYMSNFNVQWNNVQVQQPVQKQPVAQPAPKQQVQQPAPKQQTKQPAPKQQVQQPAAQQPAKKAPAQQPAKAAAPASSQVSAFEQQVLDLTNQERAKHGIPALKLDVELSKVAREKSRDMQAKGYFSHTSPTYGSPFDMMKQFGISYKSAGENIAMGQRSPQEVVTAWMNSEGHRKNILNPSYTNLGVGHVAQGNYWTQMFIGK
ncbi:CAP domain-containing protein [Bacillus canaveralius]|uniref:CAP domain-containing protein n=1 Tax=Bacillus canaveralius TaxID=1403243 RepID=UPI000F770C2D|nr:CAP domain-containing protein [Bacillus canaveralius]RSK51797.1 sporulation protein [Bacillus canaveralius]